MSLKFFKNVLSLPIHWTVKLSALLFIFDFIVYLVLGLITVVGIIFANCFPVYLWVIYFKSHIPVIWWVGLPEQFDDGGYSNFLFCWLNSAVVGFVAGFCVDVFLFIKKGRKGNS